MAETLASRDRVIGGVSFPEDMLKEPHWIAFPAGDLIAILYIELPKFEYVFAYEFELAMHARC
ncbi:hypothetical protein [Albidovulum aquaemixtae]|uniref:hypothetical protein n=1 Tax=Albidovulum aquaemixtae TaxID=1542388 RepID=UPI0011B27F73|nr:hypothetical protein [Defluviimonas aquaemixtae]